MVQRFGMGSRAYFGVAQSLQIAIGLALLLNPVGFRVGLEQAHEQTTAVPSVSSSSDASGSGYVVLEALDKTNAGETDLEPSSSADKTATSEEALNYLIWENPTTRHGAETEGSESTQTPASLKHRLKTPLRLIRSTTRPAYL